MTRLSKAPMSFLDRFKIQPKYKSTDPDVRLAAVREFTEAAATDEERAAIVALARQDADARVRRAAAARIEDVEVLAALASADSPESDEELRREVLDRLAGVAAASAAADTAVRALGALREQTQIGNVARSSPLDSVRAEAVNQLSD